MGYFDCYAEVSSDSETDNNTSDYYGLTNITRPICDAEVDAFSGSDIEDFFDESVEVKGCCFLTSEDEEQTLFFTNQ